MAIEERTLIAEEYILGHEAAELENQMAAHMGAAGCVLVGKAKEGLAVALKACGADKRNGVMCTTLGNAATLAEIEKAGAQPVFVDINPNTLNLDPYCLDYVINKCIREKQPVPKVLIATDLFGMPCKYAEIAEICARHGISVIEDMGGAFGAKDGAISAGSIGRFTVASFFESATAVIGEEGAVFCTREEDAAALRALRPGAEQQSLSGEWGHSGKAQHLLIAQMVKNAGSELSRRQLIAGWYQKRLKGFVRMQESLDKNVVSAYMQFVIMLENAEKRMAVMDRLTAERIPCAVYYPNALHEHIKKSDWRRLMFVNAERASRQLVALPMHPYLSEHVVDFICSCVLDTIKIKKKVSR
ncbi:MAG: DegT/DnrJ/EryC1/StrS aminotransferase family protein [Oscillospiraceae bacterium]|jgi:dTDP-4-amino-4,6-dideoxygalactose transaminase|nr:DegT/DnrJ/EryC1/StrS aminotransferase family protein [Oscillospiraceae bacterium]